MDGSLLRYSDVPKERTANLLWRAFVWDRMRADTAFRQLIIKSCKADILFYINTFVWTLDPRLEKKTAPFITYYFQDIMIDNIVYNLQESQKPSKTFRRWDIGIDKSRDMGVSWGVLIVLDWFWRLFPQSEFKCVSRKEEYVDKTGSMDALFPKLDFIEERLPNALQVRGMIHDAKVGRPSMSVCNIKNKSAITGETSNENAGRGGRQLAQFRDEEAFAENGEKITQSMNQSTRCQIRVSTPNGVGGSFHTAKMKAGIDWMSLHWSLHPIKAQGLYSVEDGVVKIIDQEWHKENPGYKFRIAPTHADPGAIWEFLRSPWFDSEEAAADTFQDISQEIQISYLGSGSPFFVIGRLSNIRAMHVMEPFFIGDVTEFIKEKNIKKLDIVDADTRFDKCKAWFTHDELRKPPQNTSYTIACDIATGSGASDSALAVGDDISNRKIFEYRSNGITPEDFARLTLLFCEYFKTEIGKAFLAWDRGGPGVAFGTHIIRRYAPVFKYLSKGKKEDLPGLPSNRAIKMTVMGEYQSAMFDHMFITHSEEEYAQCEQFVHDGSGGVCHQKSKSTSDNSAKGEQHGDIATASAILWQAMKCRPKPRPEQTKPPRGSFAGRMAEHRRSQQRKYSMFDC